MNIIKNSKNDNGYLQQGHFSVTMSGMKVRRQTGSISLLLVSLILVSLFFIGAAVFAVWAYQGRQDYKNNVDQKISAAVTIAKQEESTTKDKVFAEQEKSPVRTYNGPAAYGSLVIQYPKTWSAYVADDGSSDPYVDGYFYPGVVPDIATNGATFALRVQVVQESYSDVLDEFQSQVDDKSVKVSPYKLAKVPSVVGSRIDGAVEEGKTGSMILLPLRDKTLKVWTNSNQFLPDFEKYILPNLSFSP